MILAATELAAMAVFAGGIVTRQYPSVVSQPTAMVSTIPPVTYGSGPKTVGTTVTMVPRTMAVHGSQAIAKTVFFGAVLGTLTRIGCVRPTATGSIPADGTSATVSVSWSKMSRSNA